MGTKDLRKLPLHFWKHWIFALHLGLRTLLKHLPEVYLESVEHLRWSFFSKKKINS